MYHAGKMERAVKLKTSDGHTIYGTLNIAKKKNGRLVVFVHGLAGHQNEHQFYNAARFFPARGYDTFRFDLYSGLKNGRTLTASSLSMHARDLNTVIAHFKNTYRRIGVVGHSLGGPTILLADPDNRDAMVLWDPSHDMSDRPAEALVWHRAIGAYVLRWGVEFLIGRRMRNEKAAFDGKKANRLISGFHVPVKIITAGKGVLKDAGKEYYQHANKPKALVSISGAGHTFDEEGVEEQLFRETLRWFKKYLQ